MPIRLRVLKNPRTKKDWLPLLGTKIATSLQTAIKVYGWVGGGGGGRGEKGLGDMVYLADTKFAATCVVATDIYEPYLEC